MGLFRPSRDQETRTAAFQRVILTAPSPRIALGAAKAWLEYETKHLNAEPWVKDEIRQRLQAGIDALEPGLPGYDGRLARLTGDVAMWAWDLAQRNEGH